MVQFKVEKSKMSENTIYSVVHQTVQNDCMLRIERWCLTRQFASEVANCARRVWSKRLENEKCTIDLAHYDGYGELARAITASEKEYWWRRSGQAPAMLRDPMFDIGAACITEGRQSQEAA
jgi:hypothetical protein